MMMVPSIFVGQLMEDPPPFSSGMHCTNLLSFCSPRYYYYDIFMCCVVIGSIIFAFFFFAFASHLGRRRTFHDLGMLAETKKNEGEKRGKSLKSCERDGVFSFSPLIPSFSLSLSLARFPFPNVRLVNLPF